MLWRGVWPSSKFETDISKSWLLFWKSGGYWYSPTAANDKMVHPMRWIPTHQAKYPNISKFILSDPPATSALKQAYMYSVSCWINASPFLIAFNGAGPHCWIPDRVILLTKKHLLIMVKTNHHEICVFSANRDILFVSLIAAFLPYFCNLLFSPHAFHLMLLQLWVLP